VYSLLTLLPPPYLKVIHGRWAMLGVAGIVTPEILGGMGMIPKETGLVWFTSGAIPPQVGLCTS
jgi:light-harvesting complex I chlorophyll a/b binding protein 3